MTEYTSLAIALTATTFMSAPAIAVSLTPTLGENSVFSYSEGSENDYNFTLQEADAEGNLTTKYYKINLKPEAFSTSPRISWSEVGEDQKDAENVVEVKLPNNQNKYFQYTYTPEEGRTVYNTRQNNTLSGDVNADFVESSYASNGGAIYNESATIGNITGDFIDNSTSGYSNSGGAIYNYNGKIGDITGDFINNFATGEGSAIFNSKGTIGDITGNFINNYTSGGSAGSWYGGAITNYGDINNISGDFISNTSHNGDKNYGGALYNKGSIHNIIGNFIGNISNNSYESHGAAIANDGTIDNITGDFIKNYGSRNSNSGSSGGAIANAGIIGNITGNFIENFLAPNESNPSYDSSYGGAISNSGIIGDITGNFIKNHASTIGGAIINYNNISNISGNFINNYVSHIDLAFGGAVFSASNNMTFSSTADTHFFSGNYTQDKRGKIYNAITLLGDLTSIENDSAITLFGSLNFITKENGVWVINDNIDSNNILENIPDAPQIQLQHEYKFTGDGTGTVWINNDIINASKVTVDNTTLKFGAYQHEDKTALNWDGHGRFVAALNADGSANLDAPAVTKLSLNNATFDLFNQYQDTVNLAGYSATDSYLHLDVNIENLTADKLVVNGNVEGTTKLILYPTSDKDIRGESILFAESTNDTTGNADSFEVFRVYKSPYMFDVNYSQIAEGENQWNLSMNDVENPDYEVEPEPDPEPTPPTPEEPDVPSPIISNKVYSEVIAYTGLHAASVEQTRSMVSNIRSEVAANSLLPDFCLSTKDRKDNLCNMFLYNAWVNPIYHYADIKAPVDMDADIWGVEAGFDVQANQNHKIGVFASYRKGNYDLSGKSDKFYSPVGSEIDIDSYIGGLYYRYDYRHLWTFATLYGGVQKADIKTDDGIKADTDGTQLGASAETGYIFNLSDTLKLEPSLGVFYTQVDFDNVKDRVGKTAQYDTVRQTEIELGVKLEKYFNLDNGIAKVYAKPSVIQVMTSGDKVRITGFDNKVSTYDDGTLGRFELGGRYAITDQLSTYGYVNYTFGDDYDAASAGVGLSYSW